ncbi:hypothetical protein [Bacillus sp. UNCCL81]|uniref:hypothetical protein n=1 Tax=Bacillus sp. UNCCL81 TaxID=1502755 RepID=UPI0008F0E17E|nr:hypothetical protein [Bacillus sp. UNCCL81]SFD68766.1 hypothetical protein SAMN02799633_04492 [Bacillus sp. UNCCL81]
MIFKKNKTTMLLAAFTLFAVLIVQPFNNNVQAASSGYVTKGGVTAEVYTDRSGDYPSSDTYIGVTGAKTSAGGTVYYSMLLEQYKSGSWLLVDHEDGYFSSQSPMKKFYIDNLLAKGTSGTFRVEMVLRNDPNSDYGELGSWYTPSFKVYN